MRERTSAMRPKTSPSKIRTTNETRLEDLHETKNEDTELLEYEWPDLPPIPRMKDAITRKRVSHGISYLLPVDKSRISVNCKYRTDLRAMFQEPYVHDTLEYDDNKVLLSSKVHFLSNSANNKWTKRHERSIPVKINSDSDHARRQYSRSAPAGGSATRQMGIDPQKLRTRSNLFLPIKAEVPQEASKIREAAQKIISSFKKTDGEYDEEGEQANNSLHIDKDLHDTSKNENGHEGENNRQKLFHRVRAHRPTAQHFDSYEQLKHTKPPKPKIPDQVQSKFLSCDKNQEIWDWLHFGENISQFEYFLSVCG